MLHPDSPAQPSVHHLRRGGTSVVVDLSASPLPAIVYWGADLGEVPDAALASQAVAARPQRVSGGLDATARLSLIPTDAAGWLHTPGLEGHRAGASSSILFDLAEVTTATAEELVIDLADAQAQLAATVHLRLGGAGLLHQRIALRNTGSTRFTVDRLQTTFPLPWDATEILDTTGHHLRERFPQRRSLAIGTHLRESRRGRPGADATVLLAAGRPGFGFETGRVHGVHVAWSGNHRVLVERTTNGDAFLSAGELFAPGEATLDPGEELATPWAIGSWGDGLTELSERFHTEWRARPQHPRRPRPITLNTWEAVYFDHDLDRLTALADVAAEVGVERFVLDDGWFLGRRDDTAGLGDWMVDPVVWPEGLHPLVDHVRARGMEFGLWVEPEMINPDSELARAHPEWILRGRTELPPSARQQQVLNLADAGAYRYIADRLLALLDEYPISYLKWDHNRDLVDAASGPGGAPRIRETTLALYRLLDELKAAHPGLEIESCASGGARVDLGILDRTDRIWTSDNLDPLERMPMQRYTGLVVPPEMMGMHLTSPVVHSTGRTVELQLSAAVALFGHFGIEWDLTTTDTETRERIGGWVAYAKSLRPLVATGRVVHVDGTDPGIDLRGMVSQERDRAVFVLTQTASDAAYPGGPVRLPGLDADRLYTVGISPLTRGHNAGQSELEWALGEARLTGRQLAEAGLRPLVQKPQHAIVIEVTAAAE